MAVVFHPRDGCLSLREECVLCRFCKVQDEKAQCKCRLILVPRHSHHSRVISVGHQTPQFLPRVAPQDLQVSQISRCDRCAMCREGCSGVTGTLAELSSRSQTGRGIHSSDSSFSTNNSTLLENHPCKWYPRKRPKTTVPAAPQQMPTSKYRS